MTPGSPANEGQQGPPETIGAPWARAEYALATVAIVIRLALIWKFLPQPDQTENIRAGLTLASRGYLGDPFAVPTGPTAHVAPMYPALIALCVSLANDVRLGLAIARSVLAVAFGGFIVALPRVSSALGLGRKAGLLTALLFTYPAVPVFAWTEASGEHETVLTMICLVLLVSCTFVYARAAKHRPGQLILLGIAWGIGAHTSPLLLAALAGLLIGLMTTSMRSARRVIWPSAGWIVGGALLALLPWTIRNVMVVGSAAVVRDNFGLELSVSNADDASADMRENMRGARSLSRHPYFDSTQARQMAAVGEARYYAERGREARAWIRANPARFVALTLQRVRLFFLPRLGLEQHATFYLFCLFGGITGWALLFFRDRQLAMALAGAVMGYATPYFFVQGHARYSYPVLWVPALLACWAVLTLASKSGAHPRVHNR